MSVYEFSSNQKALLHNLLDRHERSKEISRRVSLKVSENRFPSYFDDANPAAVRQWEKEIEALEALSWIEVELGRGADAHRIVRISLNRSKETEIAMGLDRMSLFEFQSKISELFDNFKKQFESHRSWFPCWWGNFLEQERCTNKTFQMPESRRREWLEETEIFIVAMSRIVAPSMRKTSLVGPLTWRQFSVGEFSNSKKLNSLKPRIVKRLSDFARPDMQSLQFDEAAILVEFGIEVKQELLMLAGPFWAKSQRTNALNIEGVQWKPFAALPRQVFFDHELQWDFKLCSAVLTIENEESFQAWCRMFSGTSVLCIYLGGFPSRFKMEFLKKIPREFRFFHWGDMDVGGIQIFNYLERELNRPILPHAMTAVDFKNSSEFGQPLTEIEVKKLKSLLQELRGDHPLLPLGRAMLHLRLKVEQEAVPVQNIR